MAAEDQPEVEERGHVKMVVVSWADLVLDSENPRLEDGGDNSRETLNYLLETDTEKQIALARDIALSGELNPLDLIGVISDGGTYVVVEGNRRIAALKMLKSPELVNDLKLRRRIEKIAANGTGPDEVTCTWFDERDASRPWILLRHRGEQEGRGVVPWTGEMQERYSRDPGSQSDLAMQVRAMMLAAYSTDTDLANELDIVFYGGTATDGRRVRRRPTTLGRLLKDKLVQKSFGFTVDDGEIVLVGAEPDVHAAFRQMIFDVSEGLTARDVNSRDQITNYIDQYANLIFAPPPPSTPPAAPSGATAGGGGASTSPPPSGGATGSSATPAPQPQPTAPPPTRRRVPQEERKIFDKLKLTKFDPRTRKTLEQAQQLYIDQLPAVAGVMVRVIVELCVSEAVTALQLGAREADSLRKKLEVVLKHLDPNIEHSLRRDKSLGPAWINSQNTSGHGLGVDLMNAFVHGVTKTAAPSEVRTLSRDYRPMLERLNVEMP
jgi:hypothetical protein